jgi:hypothetical protein
MGNEALQQCFCFFNFTLTLLEQRAEMVKIRITVTPHGPYSAEILQVPIANFTGKGFSICLKFLMACN